MRTQKHYFLVSASALLLAFTTAGCTATGGGTASGGGATPIKLGYIGALSGGSAFMGGPTVKGMTLALDAVNKAGGVAGRQLNLISIDDKADPSSSATAAQKLITEDGVVAVFAGPNSGPAKANNVIVTGAGIPEIITVAEENTLIDPTSPGFPLTFRVTENNSYDIGASTSLFKSNGAKAVCVLADTTAYGDGGVITIKKVFAEKNISIKLIERHPVNSTDLTAQTLAFRNAGCDAVYVYSLAPDGAFFVKTLQQIGWKVDVIGGRGLSGGPFLSIGGAATDGVIVPETVDPNKPAAAKFIKEYDAKYGASSDPTHTYSALGYDSVMMVVAALRSTKGVDNPKELVAALNKVTLKDAVTGREESTLSWTSERHEAPSANYIVFYKAQGGAFKFLTSDVKSGN